MINNPGPGVLSYISHIDMCRPKGYGFWAFFGLKTGIHFTYFGLESGMVLERNTGMYERNYRICEFEVLLEKFFVCALI